MLKPVVAALLVSSLVAPASAHQGRGAIRVEFAGAVPCSVACMGWPERRDVPCARPFPPGSFVDRITPPAPAPRPGFVMVLEATLDPVVDWDGFLCSDDDEQRFLGGRGGPRAFPDDSCWFFGHHTETFGCHEDNATVVTAGQTVIFRAYNWTDAATATGHYWFLEI